MLVYRIVSGTEGIALRSVSYRFAIKRYALGIDFVSEPIGSPPQNGTNTLLRRDLAIHIYVYMYIFSMSVEIHVSCMYVHVYLL